MKTIQVTKYKSSELNPNFRSVRTIEIVDAPFDRGAFGEVYFCNKVNNFEISSSQVLKIFIDDGSGSAKRGYKTIVKFQEQIIKHNNYLKQKGEKQIQQVTALGAIPQFSFEGVLDGKNVMGYSSNLLPKSEWMLFSQLFNEEDLEKRKILRNNFYNSPLGHRLKMAYDLVEAFFHLEQMKFIYADLNPKNFFINSKDVKLCLIDFEGGAINENPETYGKPGEWLAPEIQEQLLSNNSPIIKVDWNTDTWAIAIAIHFMLFNFHPLFYLKVRGKKEMKEYFQKHKWPDVDKTGDNYRNESNDIYDLYIKKLQTQINPSLYMAFSETINSGFLNSSRRLSYKQWISVLNGMMIPPKIISFTTNRPAIIKGIPVLLKWNIEDAHTIIIDNQVGIVTGRTEVEVWPNKDITYKIKAIGNFGETEATVDIKLFPTPILESLKVPMPEFNNNLPQYPIQISSTHIDMSINLNIKFSEPPKFMEPSYDLQSIKPIHIDKPTTFNISKVYESIRRKISGQ